MLCFHRLHSINMKQLISLIDNTLLLNKAVIYLSFILEGRKTQLFVICQCFLSNNTSFIRLLFFGTFSLSTYISCNWFLHWLILSFRAVSNQSVQFRFRLSLSFSLCVCISTTLFFSVKYSPFPSKCFGTKKCIRTSNKTPLDLRRPIGENLLPFQVLGSSVTLPTEVPKIQSANSSRVTQFFKTL